MSKQKLYRVKNDIEWTVTKDKREVKKCVHEGELIVGHETNKQVQCVLFDAQDLNTSKSKTVRGERREYYLGGTGAVLEPCSFFSSDQDVINHLDSILCDFKSLVHNWNNPKWNAVFYGAIAKIKSFGEWTKIERVIPGEYKDDTSELFRFFITKGETLISESLCNPDVEESQLFQNFCIAQDFGCDASPSDYLAMLQYATCYYDENIGVAEQWLERIIGRIDRLPCDNASSSFADQLKGALRVAMDTNPDGARSMIARAFRCCGNTPVAQIIVPFLSGIAINANQQSQSAEKQVAQLRDDVREARNKLMDERENILSQLSELCAVAVPPLCASLKNLPRENFEDMQSVAEATAEIRKIQEQIFETYNQFAAKLMQFGVSNISELSATNTSLPKTEPTTEVSTKGVDA